jgi:hypothetical protein
MRQVATATCRLFVITIFESEGVYSWEGNQDVWDSKLLRQGYYKGFTTPDLDFMVYLLEMADYQVTML